MKKLSRNEMKKVLGGGPPIGNCYIPYRCNTPSDCNSNPNPCTPASAFLRWECPACTDPQTQATDHQCLAVCDTV